MGLGVGVAVWRLKLLVGDVGRDLVGCCWSWYCGLGWEM